MKKDFQDAFSVLEENDVSAIRYAGSNRIEIWRITLKLIGKQPLLGCGTDNLRRGIIMNCPVDLYQYIRHSGAVIDKAHNEYLQIAATLGIPALLIYLIFLGSILRDKIKFLFQNKVAFTFCLVIFSYLVQAFFNISTIGIAPLFWMILGLADNPQFLDALKNQLPERLYLK